jgi:hypothetical protein
VAAFDLGSLSTPPSGHTTTSTRSLSTSGAEASSCERSTSSGSRWSA